MKILFFWLAAALLFNFGCSKDEIGVSLGITDGFCLKIANEEVITHDDIDYYDFSSHLIYLKKEATFLKNITKLDSFFVYADKEEIYKGFIRPAYLSLIQTGPYIGTQPVFYNSNIISIDFLQFWDMSVHAVKDPRSDEKIANALKRYNQFHAGLSCVIKSVTSKVSGLSVDLTLTNLDTYNYYFLDPEKMGTGLFHYFTNGLYLTDTLNNKSYSHKLTVVSPVPWNIWKKEWLTRIKSGETRTISITYEKFDTIPSGTYRTSFEFPGLTYQVDQKDLQQSDGRIWLGRLSTTKNITLL
jgi:hypothetical protein